MIVFLHDRGNQNTIGILVFALFEFVEPDIKWPIADQFDVFPTDYFLPVVSHELGITRGDVDDLGGIETDRLGDHRAPAFPERAGDDIKIRPGWTRSDDERVREL